MEESDRHRKLRKVAESKQSWQPLQRHQLVTRLSGAPKSIIQRRSHCKSTACGRRSQCLTFKADFHTYSMDRQGVCPAQRRNGRKGGSHRHNCKPKARLTQGPDCEQLCRLKKRLGLLSLLGFAATGRHERMSYSQCNQALHVLAVCMLGKAVARTCTGFVIQRSGHGFPDQA